MYIFLSVICPPETPGPAPTLCSPLADSCVVVFVAAAPPHKADNKNKTTLTHSHTHAVTLATQRRAHTCTQITHTHIHTLSAVTKDPTKRI